MATKRVDGSYPSDFGCHFFMRLTGDRARGLLGDMKIANKEFYIVGVENGSCYEDDIETWRQEKEKTNLPSSRKPLKGMVAVYLHDNQYWLITF